MHQNNDTGRVTVAARGDQSSFDVPRRESLRAAAKIPEIRALLLGAATSSTTAADLARLGLGLIQAPRYRFEKDLADGTLVEVLADYPPSPTPLSALYPRNRQLSPSPARLPRLGFAHLRRGEPVGWRDLLRTPAPLPVTLDEFGMAAAIGVDEGSSHRWPGPCKVQHRPPDIEARNASVFITMKGDAGRRP